MQLKFKPVVWLVLVSISMVCAHFGMDDGNLLVLFVIVLGLFLLPLVVLGVVVLVAKLLHRSPSLPARRWIFLSIWAVATFGQLCRQL